MLVLWKNIKEPGSANKFKMEEKNMKKKNLKKIYFILLTFTSGLWEIHFNFTFPRSQCVIGLDENKGPAMGMFMLILC